MVATDNKVQLRLTGMSFLQVFAHKLKNSGDHQNYYDTSWGRKIHSIAVEIFSLLLTYILVVLIVCIALAPLMSLIVLLCFHCVWVFMALCFYAALLQSNFLWSELIKANWKNWISQPHGSATGKVKPWGYIIREPLKSALNFVPIHLKDVEIFHNVSGGARWKFMTEPF